MPISSMSSVEMILKPTTSSSVVTSASSCLLYVDSKHARGQVWTHGHLASDTGVYARVRQEPLFVRDVKETPMRNPRLCGRRLDIPSIEVCVKVNDRNGPVDPVQRTENGEDDRVVTAKASATVRNGRKGEGETYVTIFGCSLLSLARGRVECTMTSVSVRATSRCKSVE
jgi:hypothetical protein